MTDDQGLGRGLELLLRQGGREELAPHDGADLVVLEGAAKHHLSLDAGGDFRHLHGGRHEVSALALADHLEDDLLGTGLDGVAAGTFLALESVQELLGDVGALVVEDARGAQALAVVEVLGGGGGEYLVARSDGQLDGVAADAGGTGPD